MAKLWRHRAGSPTIGAMTEPADLVQSVSRALRVLEEVSRADHPLPVKAVARRCRLNLSTTYHLVRTLAYEGYLVRTVDGCYVPGPEVSRRVLDIRLAMSAAPGPAAALSHLTAVTGHTTYLARVVDGRIVITQMAEGPASPYLEDLQVGLPASAHATAAGKALLATMTPGRRRVYLADQGLRAFTSRTTTDPGRIEAEAVRVRPGRPVVEHGEFRDGVSCAAVLVRPREPDEVWSALVVSARAPDVSEPVTRELLRTAADLSL